MKLRLPHTNTAFLSNLSTLGWKGSYNMEKDTVVVVESHSIVTLSDYLMEHKRLTYESVEQMILHLGNQMIVLSEVGIGMLFFNLNSISVLDDTYFLISDLTNGVPLNSKEQLSLTYPLKMTGLLSPELKNISTLPVVVSITSGYYSLALLCIECLGIDNSLDSIMNTKMYFFLQRCLHKDPHKRYFLYL